MYWVINNAYHPGHPKQAFMRPDEQSELRMARQRMSRAQQIDTRFVSRYDAFKNECELVLAFVIALILILFS